MSTNSSISIKQGDTIKTIYCHWDGYLSHNGSILLEHYTTDEKVNKLISLGDISILAENIETDKPHTFQNPVDGVVLAYARDRGETDVEARTYKIDDVPSDEAQEFNYLFDDGNWFYRRDKKKGWTLMTANICQ